MAELESVTSSAYALGDGLGVKYFFRLGSFQICHAVIGTGEALQPHLVWNGLSPSGPVVQKLPWGRYRRTAAVTNACHASLAAWSAMEESSPCGRPMTVFPREWGGQ